MSQLTTWNPMSSQFPSCHPSSFQPAPRYILLYTVSNITLPGLGHLVKTNSIPVKSRTQLKNQEPT